MPLSMRLTSKMSFTRLSKMVAGGENLAQAVLHLAAVVQVACRNGGKAYDGVHGGAYVVRHVGEKGRLGLVGVARLHEGVLQGPGLPALQPDLLCYVARDGHGHYFARQIVLAQIEGLAHADLPAFRRPCPVIKIDLAPVVAEAFEKPGRVHDLFIALCGFLQHKVKPGIEKFGGPAGQGKPPGCEQGDGPAVHGLDYILLDQVLADIELVRGQGA